MALTFDPTLFCNRYKLLGIRTLEEADKYEQAKRRDVSGDMAAAFLEQLRAPGRRGPGGGRGRQSRWLTRDSTETASAAQPVDNTVQNEASSVAAGPGADELTSEERDLCGQLGLAPAAMLAAKEMILRETVRIAPIAGVVVQNRSKKQKRKSVGSGAAAVPLSIKMKVDIEQTGSLSDISLSSLVSSQSAT